VSSRHHNVIASIVNYASFQNNKLPVIISGNKLSALIDSGSAFSVLPLKFLHNLPFHIQKKFSKDIKTCCYTASGQKMRILGHITLPVQINDTRYNVKFRILPELSQDCIIGLDFLQAFNVKLDFSTNSMYIRLRTPVLACKDIIVPPKCEIICCAVLKTNTKVPTGSVGMCEIFPSLYEKHLLAAKAIVNCYDNYVPIKICNPTNIHRQIRKGERLATFYPVNESDLCSLENTEDTNKQNPSVSSETTNK
jgi:hypothetical protein